MADTLDETEVEDSSLSAIIAEEIGRAQTFDQSKRSLAIEYMRGEMRDIPARVNGSSQTDSTVADTISWILPGTVRVFTASDQMVEFEATQDGGEKGSEEASEYTNYSFFRENDGYRILYNATYDSLLMGNGAACSYWCPEVAKTQLFKDKTAEELAFLINEEGWQGLGQAPKPGAPKMVEDQMAGEVEVPTFTVRLQKITERGQIRDMTLKPENLELSGNATTIEDSRYVAYLHDDKTRSDLLEMADEYGWDAAVIEELPRYQQVSTNEVATARSNWVAESTGLLKSSDPMRLRECYLRADRDGDGIAELLQVWCVGDASDVTILSVDDWEDDIPFTDIPCYPVPHQWEAEGVYDRTADIQRVKTVLLRQLLDNSYAVGMPMKEVDVGSVENPDILTNPRFGGLIWKKKDSADIRQHEIPFIGDKLLLGLQYMDTVRSMRTGVSKTTMALDPEALQNQTATSTQLQHDAGYSQIELIARNMAELGWTKFFAKRRNLAKKYIKQAIKVPSRNGDAPQMPMAGQQMAPGQPAPEPSKYRTIQPEKWSDDMACTINVGLGTGSRDRDMAMLNVLLRTQTTMATMLKDAGISDKAIEFMAKIRKTAVEMTEASGLRSPDEYWPDISEEDVAKYKEAAAKPKPPPGAELEMIKGQQNEKLETMRGQTTLAVKQGENQLAAQQAEIDSAAAVRREAAQLEADLRTKEADRQNDLILEDKRQAFEREKLASNERIKTADRKMQWNLELLKLKVADAAEGDGSEDDPEVKPKADTHNETLMAGIGKLGEMLGAMQQSFSAPTEIVRDPKTGRATGTRKVMN